MPAKAKQEETLAALTGHAARHITLLQNLDAQHDPRSMDPWHWPGGRRDAAMGLHAYRAFDLALRALLLALAEPPPPAGWTLQEIVSQLRRRHPHLLPNYRPELSLNMYEDYNPRNKKDPKDIGPQITGFPGRAAAAARDVRQILKLVQEEQAKRKERDYA